MALAGAVLALLVLSLLVTTAFLTGYLEQRAARGTADAVHALAAAEAGLAMLGGEWEGLGLSGTLAVGDSAVLPSVPLGARAAFTPRVWRLSEHVFLIRSDGVRVDAGGTVLARSAVGLLGRTEGVTLVPLPQRSWLHVY